MMHIGGGNHFPSLLRSIQVCTFGPCTKVIISLVHTALYYLSLKLLARFCVMLNSRSVSAGARNS